MQSLISIICTDLITGGPIARAVNNFEHHHPVEGEYLQTPTLDPPLVKLGQGEYEVDIQACSVCYRLKDRNNLAECSRCGKLVCVNCYDADFNCLECQLYIRKGS